SCFSTARRFDKRAYIDLASLTQCLRPIRVIGRRNCCPCGGVNSGRFGCGRESAGGTTTVIGAPKLAVPERVLSHSRGASRRLHQIANRGAHNVNAKTAVVAYAWVRLTSSRGQGRVSPQLRKGQSEPG